MPYANPCINEVTASVSENEHRRASEHEGCIDCNADRPSTVV